MALNKDTVRSIFGHLESGDADSFFKYVNPDVDWTVMGTHPLAGRYTSLDSFRKSTFERLAPCLTAPLQLSVTDIHLDDDVAVVELRALSIAKNGWDFDNRYCWVVEFNNGVIVRVRAYLDSNMVAQLIAEGEEGSSFYR